MYLNDCRLNHCPHCIGFLTSDDLKEGICTQVLAHRIVHFSPPAEVLEQIPASELPSDEFQVQAAKSPDVVGRANDCPLEVAFRRSV